MASAQPQSRQELVGSPVMFIPALPQLRSALFGGPKAASSWSSPSKADDPAVLATDTLDAWLQPQSEKYNGLVVRRPFHGQFDEHQPSIDKAVPRFGKAQSICITVDNGLSPEALSYQLDVSMAALLAKADLPAPLSKQIHADGCSLGKVIGSMCPFARELELRLDIFGANVCSR